MKKYIFIVALAIILGLALFLVFPRGEEMREIKLEGLENSYKNKLVNISERYAIKDNRIYFIKGIHDGQLYIMDFAGKNITKVLDDKIYDFKLDDKWIYYSTIDGLYKSSYDGNTKIKLAEGHISKIQIIKNEIFYSEFKSSGFNDLRSYIYLYKVDTDGKSNVKVSEDMPFDFVATNENIFYIASGYPYFSPIIEKEVANLKKDKFKLYKMSLDITNKEYVTEIDSLSLDYSDNKIFYHKNNGLYGINSNGINTETKILEFVPDDIFVNGTDIYYIKDMHGIYRMDMKSGVKKRVIRSLSKIDQINVIGDWVFYETYRKSIFGGYIDTIWVVNKDGSHKQLFMRY